MENVQLLKSPWQWMISFPSRLERYSCHFWLYEVSSGEELCISFNVGIILQIGKPRPVQAASIPGMLGMFQIVSGSVP